MAEHDPFTELGELARVGEEYAHPLPADRVRQLGRQRRARRQIGLVAAAVVATIVAGGAVVTMSGLRADRVPDPVTTPTVAAPTPMASSAPPQRSLMQANLITADEIPNPAGDRIVVTEPGLGRPVETASICVPENGWDALGSSQVLTRNFRFDYKPPGFNPDPDHPMYNVPQFYTAALQFADEAAAERGLALYRGWLTDCAAELKRRDHILIGSRTKTTWVAVPSGSATIGEFAVLPTYERPDAKQVNGEYEGAYWEHVGLIRVVDRVMITVEVIWGNEYHDSLLPGGDPDTGMPPNVQFGLVKAAAARLTGAPVPQPSPTATPSNEPQRKLTTASLLTIDEVPPSVEHEVQIADADGGRPVSEASACVPRGKWGSLAATQVLTRNFRWNYEQAGSTPPADPRHPEYNPLYNLPRLYTAALQFADEAAAEQAQARYREWLSDCAAELKGRGYIRGSQVRKTRWINVPAQPSGGRTVGEFATLPTYLPPGNEMGGDGSGPVYWEHVGLTRVEDRLMITVEVAYGLEYGFSERPDGDEVSKPNYQFELVRAAARRLAP